MKKRDERARVHLPDVIIAVAVFVAIAAVAPVIVGMVQSVEFDPFTEMMLTLVVPAMLLGLLISVGVSAVRRD